MLKMQKNVEKVEMEHVGDMQCTVCCKNAVEPELIKDGDYLTGSLSVRLRDCA